MGHFAALLIGLLSFCWLPISASQESPSTRVNKGTVSIMAGGINGTYIRIASDLANVLDADDLRVLAIIGKGSVKNIEDLLYLKGIDLAIVQSDVMEFLRRNQIHYNLDKRIRYVTKLYNEEVHVLAHKNISQLSDLAGKKVNIDGQGSGTAMTASLIFETLAIPITPVYEDQANALEMLKQGEIDALVYVAGKPARLFQQIAATEQLHFIPIAITPALLDTYLPTRLSADDYPNLIADSKTIDTLAVGAVLAVFNWRSDHWRYGKAARLVQRFFTNFEQLLQPPRHPKWREVSLAAVVPGWQRFRIAEEWLRKQRNQ